MTIDIDRLSESELIDLNHRIVARLRLLRQLEAHASMLEFRIGERVRFHPEGRPVVTGTITRYNKKTVSIVTEDGQLWNVAPLDSLKRGAAQAGGVIHTAFNHDFSKFAENCEDDRRAIEAIGGVLEALTVPCWSPQG